MPWTEITCRQYGREGLRYASHLTDEEWTLIAPYLPKDFPPYSTVQRFSTNGHIQQRQSNFRIRSV